MASAVELIEHFFIPLEDGTRLAARLWRPQDALRNPVPALLEFLPYRKSDGTAPWDPVIHGYFARHGYASLRVDMRGSGDSDGLLTDEYTPQEQADAVEVIEWLAGQPWCDGRVGMFGISWGGFNALQVAALQPRALGAVITSCSTDDRYADDVHFIGGCVDAHDALGWATTFTALQARPPSPLTRDDWRDVWLERLDALPLFAATWLEHPQRDDYWRHGSVCESYGRIRCPVFVVGGWADGYKNASLRLVEGLSAPCKALIGPWAHGWPNMVRPGPRIAFLNECVRWWDRWLKDRPTGIDAEPRLVVWQQDSVTPATSYAERPGRWIAEMRWPAANGRITPRRLFAGPDGLSDAPTIPVPATVATDLRHGIGGGVWCPFGAPGDLPGDQQAENAYAWCRAAAPVAEPQSILGCPELRLAFVADSPRAHAVVRLNDLAPDGSALLVSRGVLNLCHRAGHDVAQPLVAGKRYDVTIRLDATSHRLAAGHCWQLAIAPSYWPMVWPLATRVSLQVMEADLSLPVRAPSPLDTTLRSFGPPDGDAPLPVETLEPPTAPRRYDVTEESIEIERGSSARTRLPDGLMTSTHSRDLWRVERNDPATANVHCSRSVTFERGEWHVHIEVDAHLSCDARAFYLTQTVDAYEGDTQVRSLELKRRIARDSS